MLKALHHCHRVVNVTHKNIKPDNIMIGENSQAMLIDFGTLALVKCKEARSLQSSKFVAPEVWQGLALGPESDIW